MSLAPLTDLFAFALTLLFVVLVVSIIASQMVEAYAGLRSTRGAMLRERLARVLDDPDENGFAHSLFSSPLFRSLQRKGNFPDYVPAETFAQAVVAVIREKGIVEIGNLPPVLRALALAEGFAGDAGREAFRDRVVEWYDRSMERLSGHYRQTARARLFLCGLALAVVFNINLVDITATLWAQRGLLGPASARIAALHEEVAAAREAGETPEIDQTRIEEILADPALGAVGIPLGWSVDRFRCPSEDAPTGTESCGPIGFARNFIAAIFSGETAEGASLGEGGRLRDLFGWLLTALAVLPGASFWFDAIGKILALRAVGRSPSEEARKKAAAQSAASESG